MRHVRNRDVAKSGHDVDQARRESGLLDELAKVEDRHRRVLRWLANHGAAGGKGRSELPGRDHQQRGPRNESRKVARR